jgi:hypothetical protein
MEGWAVRKIFGKDVLATMYDVDRWMFEIDVSWSLDEIRCHELARAVAIRLDLDIRGKTLSPQIIDGQVDAVEHTWILLNDKGKRALLDVYTPGRMPQVQLIDCHWTVAKNYKKGEFRTDIRLDVVDRLVEELRKCL